MMQCSSEVPARHKRGPLVYAEAKLCRHKGAIKPNAKSPGRLGLYAGLRGKERWLTENFLGATQVRRKNERAIAVYGA